LSDKANLRENDGQLREGGRFAIFGCQKQTKNLQALRGFSRFLQFANGIPVVIGFVEFWRKKRATLWVLLLRFLKRI
jgi:hypothetical protein